MVSRRPNPKDISLFLKNFARINFRESPILKNFAGINFSESTFSGVKKGIYFREFGQNSRNFLPAKISSLKVNCITLKISNLESAADAANILVNPVTLSIYILCRATCVT